MRQQHLVIYDGKPHHRAAHSDERAISDAKPFTAERAGVRFFEYVAHEPAKVAVLSALRRRDAGSGARPCELQYFIRSNRINK